MTAPSSLFHKTFTPPPPTTFALRPFSVPFSTDTVLGSETVTGQMSQYNVSNAITLPHQTQVPHPFSYDQPIIYSGSRLGYPHSLNSNVINNNSHNNDTTTTNTNNTIDTICNNVTSTTITPITPINSINSIPSQDDSDWTNHTNCLGIKRGYEYPFEKDYETESHSSYERSFSGTSPTESNKRTKVPALSFYVDITTPYRNQSISQSMMMTPLSNIPTGCEKLERIRLESLTVEELTIKLCSLLVLHTDRVSDVLWRRSKVPSGDIQSRTDKTNKHKSDTILVLVEDAVVAQHILENSVIVVEWEIKADSTVRIILQF
ncbi:hypothetical protein J3Q64DRAFT_1754378 [Phycomyces blakesleeanus]|uniref:Ornithine decarboxylase antizyme n=1 Tax=Phycomyces blakesleeanus TaxID=4837 RepID=A0ABR3AU93_PHYBL